MTNPDLHARASALFLELRALPAREQERALTAVDDERLRREVASLLEHDPGDAASHAALQPPERVGHYRILHPIGHGSSGHVFLAEQSEPIRRRVAIKFVPAAAQNAELAARFEVERRALECTDHPGIARIIDAGRTPDGLPFLVMDFVEGPPITTYCEREALPLAARIELALGVAAAIQHAHQRGVVHRDLKPANILVAETDGRPVARVLDFGIAKPLGGPIAADTPPTSGLPIGTPSYMAPEQTGLEPIDTRADVYALGAVLYEMVGGRPPIDAGGDPLEVLHAIRERVPAPVARLRPDAGPRALLADLSCVLAKALEKRPDDRYASMDALAQDLTRLLRGEPIEARPPTWRYRAGRFAQRNRVLVFAGAVALLAIAIGLGGLVVGFVHATRQEREAQRQTETQVAINRFLREDLLRAASPDEAGPTTTALELLQRASARLDARYPDRPLVAAAVHQTLADTFAVLGEFDSAQLHVTRALDLYRGELGPDAPDVVRAEIAAASLLLRRERLKEAEEALRTSLPRARRLLGPYAPELHAVLNDLGLTLEALGRPAAALPLLEEALEGRQRLLAPNHRDVLATLNALALTVDQMGETERALELMLDALARAELEPDEERFTQLGLNNNIGATYQDIDEDERAAPYIRKAAEMALELVGPDHPATLTIQGNLAGLESELGDPLRAREIYAGLIERQEALLGPAASDALVARYGYWDCTLKAKEYGAAAAGFRTLLGDIGAALDEEHWLAAQTAASLALALVETGALDEALTHAVRAEARLRALFGPDHTRTKSAAAVLARIRVENGD